jgi:hypothetical protein
MELDELKLAWQAMETRVEALETRRTVDKVRSLGGPTRWELAGNVVGVLLTGNFLFHYGAELRFLLPGLALHLVAILTIATGVRQVVLFSRLDLSRSVLETQRTLLALQAERLRVNRALLTFIPLLWVPLVIVLARCIGIDLYRLSPAWLWSNVAFGLAMVPVGIWLAKRLGDRLSNPELARALHELSDSK